MLARLPPKERCEVALHLDTCVDPARERLLRWRVGELPARDEIRRVLRPEA